MVLARKRALSSVRPEVAMSVQEEDPSARHCALSCRGGICGDDDAGESERRSHRRRCRVSSSMEKSGNGFTVGIGGVLVELKRRIQTPLGASLTAVIEVSSSTVESEKTVVSPFGSASTVSPLLGAVEESSTSRVVRAPGVPLKSEAGRKRSLVVLARKRALSSVRPEVAMEVQEEDPSACHCQVP